jgi:hypothetical protein
VRDATPDCCLNNARSGLLPVECHCGRGSVLALMAHVWPRSPAFSVISRSGELHLEQRGTQARGRHHALLQGEHIHLPAHAACDDDMSNLGAGASDEFGILYP